MAANVQPCVDHNHTRGSQNTPPTVVNHRSNSRSQSDTVNRLSLPSDDYKDEQNQRDIERGPPNIERVVLLVDGLQCGCCDNGISRAVARIPAIQSHQVNVVLARLELELDTNSLSVAEVITRLCTQTGYSFEEHVTPGGQVLELLATDARTILDAGMPFGIKCIEPPDKQPWRPSTLLSGRNSTGPLRHDGASDMPEQEIAPNRPAHPIRIHYDATQVGARDIFEYYQTFDNALCLAPPTMHPSLAMGARQTGRALIDFLRALLFTLPVLILAWVPIDHTKLLYAHISLGCATIVQAIAIKEFVPNALRSLWYCRVFEMDFLIALSSTLAYVFSVVSYTFQVKGKPLETGSFFETSTLLVTLILLGRLVNEFARYRAAKSVSFRSLQIDQALLVLPNATHAADPKTRQIDARLLQYGDQFKVAPHMRVVTDGIILYGGSEIDESMITGESVPVAKGVHSKVFAGTTNGGGELVVKLTALPHENSVNRIATMVEDAELTKPKTQALADRIAGWFVPAMAAIGLTVFLIWLFGDRFITKRSWKDAIVQAMTYGIATLVVSCPCAIGLAVPMVVLIAGGVAARFGIIFRDPQKLELARNVTDVVFDKTGTLTCAVLTVFDEEYYSRPSAQTKGILLSLLQDITHPVAAGVLRHLQRDANLHPSDNIKPIPVTNITSIPGSGLSATCPSLHQKVHAGNPHWLHLSLSDSHYTLLCITIDAIHTATFKLKDRPRHTAPLVISRLHAQGIQTHMLSGDGPGPVNDTAHTLHIPKQNTKSRCSPADKSAYVRALQRPGRVIMFVGDGTNDAIALKQADIGVHINRTSEPAKHAADIVLITARLHDVLILLDISRAAYRRIVLNFAWAGVYNVGAVLLAAGAFTAVLKRARIRPEYAGLGELVSVLPVVVSAVQMRWRDYGRRYRAIEYDWRRGEEGE